MILDAVISPIAELQIKRQSMPLPQVWSKTRCGNASGVTGPAPHWWKRLFHVSICRGLATVLRQCDQRDPTFRTDPKPPQHVSIVKAED
jgi:hypothetical protein